MPTITPTLLEQISAEKTKVSERLIRLDADRAAVATQLTDLETAERVLMRVSKTPTARRLTSAAAAEAKTPTATRGRGRPPKATTRKSAGRKPNAPSLGERVLALATGKTRKELYRVPQRSPEPYRRSAAPYPCRRRRSRGRRLSSRPEICLN